MSTAAGGTVPLSVVACFASCVAVSARATIRDRGLDLVARLRQRLLSDILRRLGALLDLSLRGLGTLRGALLQLGRVTAHEFARLLTSLRRVEERRPPTHEHAEQERLERPQQSTALLPSQLLQTRGHVGELFGGLFRSLCHE